MAHRNSWFMLISVDLPNLKMVIFHSYVNVYQRVIRREVRWPLEATWIPSQCSSFSCPRHLDKRGALRWLQYWLSIPPTRMDFPWNKPETDDLTNRTWYELSRKNADWWFGTFGLFFHSVGNFHRSQLTFTPWFFRGVGLNHQPE